MHCAPTIHVCIDAPNSKILHLRRRLREYIIFFNSCLLNNSVSFRVSLLIKLSLSLSLSLPLSLSLSLSLTVLYFYLLAISQFHHFSLALNRCLSIYQPLSRSLSPPPFPLFILPHWKGKWSIF
jgi:hypothetical protein